MSQRQGPSEGQDSSPRVVVVTGMSGAGRGTAARCLEDLGWLVVDNLPPALIGAVVDVASQGQIDKVAVVVDARTHGFGKDLQSSLEQLRASGHTPSIIFLEASDDVLIRRFEATRRPHPLQGRVTETLLVDEISRERRLLASLRGDADLIIDTSDFNVHELHAKINATFGQEHDSALRAMVVSFGYKYGLPLDADLVIDCRWLPNPYWVPELRPKTGRDLPVHDYVLSSAHAPEFLDSCRQLLKVTIGGYQQEARPFLTVAIGCTGGKHRSVAIAEEIGAYLRDSGVQTTVLHRDLGRE